MKKILFILTVAVQPVFFASCKRADVQEDLITIWIEDGGTRTVEISKNDFIFNGVSMRDKGAKLFVEDGQVWNEKGGDQFYLYDYKLSGNNLFLQTETTVVWSDPSAPANLGIKFIKQ